MLPRREASDRQFRDGSSSSPPSRNRGPAKQSPRDFLQTGNARERRGSGGGGGGGGVESSGNDRREKKLDFDAELSDEEIKYLETQDNVGDYSETLFGARATKHTRSNQYKTYTPTDISDDSLQGMGPALALGERGMSETFGDKMIQVNKNQAEYDKRVEDLAQKWAEGEFCHFRSKQERDHTTRTVERNLAGLGDNAELDEEKEKEKTELVDTRMAEETERLATRLLKGEYHIGPLGKGPTAELLERYTSRNETYLTKDRQSLAEKVGSLLPLKTAPSSAQSARK